jgi:ABC-2 type transport system permease protein
MIALLNNYPWSKVFRRELHRLRRQRTLLFVTFIGPVLGFLLILWIFSANVPRELPVAVIDHDHTSLSRQIARLTDATSIASVNRNFISLEEARVAMNEGKIEAVLYIPEGTEREVYRGQHANLAFYINNTNILKGGLLNTGVRKVLGTMSAGVKLQMQMKGGLNRDQAMSRVVPVQITHHLLFNPFTSYSYYLTAGMVPIMLIVFVLLGTIYVIGDELYRGTGPQWIKLANGNFLWALFGKLLPYTVIYCCMAVFMDLILFYYLGMPLEGKFPIILLGEFFLILAYQAVAIFLLGLTSNLRLSLSLGAVYAMLALTFSGLTFPLAGMSAFSQGFGAIFPYTYWLKIFLGQSLRGEPVLNTIIPLAALLLFIVLGVLYIPRLKYMMYNEKRWGKI